MSPIVTAPTVTPTSTHPSVLASFPLSIDTSSMESLVMESLAMEMGRLDGEPNTTQSTPNLSRSRRDVSHVTSRGGAIDTLRSTAHWMERSIAKLTQSIKRKAMRSATRYLSQAAHDFRSPLAVASGAIGLAYRESMKQGASATARHLEIASQQLFRLSQQVDHTMEARWLLSKRIPTRRVWVEPNDWLRENLELFVPLLEMQGITLQLDGWDMPLPRILIDQQHLTRLITNLLHNAVRASTAGSVIKLSAQPKLDQAWMTIRVSDQGSGMGSKEANTLMGLDTSTSLASQSLGHGLGLKICHTLSEQLLGKIEVAPASLKGTTVSLTLPANQPASLAQAFLINQTEKKLRQETRKRMKNQAAADSAANSLLRPSKVQQCFELLQISHQSDWSESLFDLLDPAIQSIQKRGELIYYSNRRWWYLRSNSPKLKSSKIIKMLEKVFADLDLPRKSRGLAYNWTVQRFGVWSGTADQIATNMTISFTDAVRPRSLVPVLGDRFFRVPRKETKKDATAMATKPRRSRSTMSQQAIESVSQSMREQQGMMERTLQKLTKPRRTR